MMASSLTLTFAMLVIGASVYSVSCSDSSWQSENGDTDSYTFQTSEYKNKNEKISTVEIVEISKRFLSLTTLDFGARCDSKLEVSGKTSRDKALATKKKFLVNKYKNVIEGKSEDEFEVSDSLEESFQDTIRQLREYVNRIEKSQVGKVCNGSNLLYCDETVNQCRCGSSDKIRGFSFQHDRVSSSCNFELGSGCLPEESTEFTCQRGTACMTNIENKECNFLNTAFEIFNNPSRSRALFKRKGYNCFCNDNTGRNNNRNQDYKQEVNTE